MKGEERRRKEKRKGEGKGIMRRKVESRLRFHRSLCVILCRSLKVDRHFESYPCVDSLTSLPTPSVVPYIRSVLLSFNGVLKWKFLVGRKNNGSFPCQVVDIKLCYPKYFARLCTVHLSFRMVDR